MDASERVITELPLLELWDRHGPVAAERRRNLTAADMRDLLKRGAVRFVVADVGAKPVWIPESRCFEFWKNDVQTHFADIQERPNLDEFAGAFFYFASEWAMSNGPPIVVLERQH
jgi:hypothetical protein